MGDNFHINDPSYLATEKVVAVRLDKEAIEGTRSSNLVGNQSVQKGMSDPSAGHRKGEILVAVPEPEPEAVKARTLSKSERQKYEKQDVEHEQQRLDLLTSQILQGVQGVQIPEPLLKLCRYFAATTAAVLVLLLVSQATSTLAQIRMFPVWSQWCIGVLLAFVVVVILYIVVKLLTLFFKLKKNEQINLTSVKNLASRDALRHIVSQKNAQSVATLRAYILDFPTDQEAQFVKFGITRADYAILQETRLKLLEPSSAENPERFIELFVAGFQLHLDSAATNISKNYAKKVALKTAVSPLSLLDNAIVLSLNLLMVKDFMTLYNLRMNLTGAGYILLQAIGQTYIAGELQDMTESLADSIRDMLNDHVASLAAGVAGIVLAKTGEGLANGIMTYRLGKTVARLLKPSC